MNNFNGDHTELTEITTQPIPWGQFNPTPRHHLRGCHPLWRPISRALRSCV